MPPQAQSGGASGPIRNQNAIGGGKGKGEEKATQIEGGRGRVSNAKGKDQVAVQDGEAGAGAETVEHVATMQVGQGVNKKEGG